MQFIVDKLLYFPLVKSRTAWQSLLMFNKSISSSSWTTCPSCSYVYVWPHVLILRHEMWMAMKYATLVLIQKNLCVNIQLLSLCGDLWKYILKIGKTQKEAAWVPKYLFEGEYLNSEILSWTSCEWKINLC